MYLLPVCVTVYDPWANPEVARHEYGLEIKNKLPEARYDAIVLAVAHQEFAGLKTDRLTSEKHVVFDVKGFWEKDRVDARL